MFLFPVCLLLFLHFFFFPKMCQGCFLIVLLFLACSPKETSCGAWFWYEECYENPEVFIPLRMPKSEWDPDTWLVSLSSNLVKCACLWRLMKTVLREYCKSVCFQNGTVGLFGHSCVNYHHVLDIHRVLVWVNVPFEKTSSSLPLPRAILSKLRC